MWLLYVFFLNPITGLPLQTFVYGDTFTESAECVELGEKIGNEFEEANAPVPFKIICVEADRSGSDFDEPELGKPKPGQIQI